MLAGIEWMANRGLNLYACFDCAALPTSILDVIASAGIDLERYSRLLLLGHGGRTLWEQVQSDWQADDPIDNYSIRVTKQFLHDYCDDAPHHILYPLTDMPLPLQQLGMLAGWHHRAPLGIGINGVYGVWFAYRVAVLTTAVLAPTEPMDTPSPCTNCVDKPCVSACPGRAVGEVGGFQAIPCFTHRVKSNSSCADRCLSRLACPYFPEHRYSDTQIQYHYTLSLPSLRAYLGQ